MLHMLLCHMLDRVLSTIRTARQPGTFDLNETEVPQQSRVSYTQTAAVYSPVSDLPHRTVISMCQDRSGHSPNPIPMRQITASSMVPKKHSQAV